MEELLQQCEQTLSDLSFATVRDWKAKTGGKAVAYFPVYAPVELLHACDVLPVGLNGAGDNLDLQHADARFGSFICSIVKSTLEMGLTERLDVFDGFLFSSICDSARNLCWVMKRNLPKMYLDFLHLPHNPNSRSGVEYLASEYRRLGGEMEKISGVRPSEERLRASIALYNRNRELIRQLYELRRQSPHLLRTSELYLLVRAGNFLPAEEHARILELAVERFPWRPAKPRDSVRVVVEGSFCEQPPLALIRLLEEAGCYVVEDDFGLGQRWFESDVPETGDPIEQLADGYLNRSVYSSVRHDFRKPRWAGLEDKVRRTQADAVLFLIAKFCEPAYFDYVMFKQKLEQTGTPHLLLEFEEKMFTFERLRTEVETFVESLVFQ